MSLAYDAWGNSNITYPPIDDEDSFEAILAKYPPIRYRSYYYDFELELYWLGTRCYDSVTGRFLSPDSIMSGTNGSLHGFNLYEYCFNNPIMYTDPDGNWPKWEDIKKWFKNTFGAGSSTTGTVAEIETPKIPDPSPITIKTGWRITQIISKHGDASKLFSVYANKDAQHPIKSSSVGININIDNFTFNLSLGLDNIGISGSSTNGNATNNFGIRMNLSELKVGFESSTAIQRDNITETAYTNASVSGWAIAAAYILLTTGQYVQSPSYAY